MAKLRLEMLDAIGKMQAATTYRELQYYHTKVQFFALEETWVACRKELDSLLVIANSTTLFMDQSSCPDGSWNYQTPTYFSDACCSKTYQYTFLSIHR